MSRLSIVLILVSLVFISCKDAEESAVVSEIIKVETNTEAHAVTVTKETKDFDFPVGKHHAKGYYNAQPFGKNNHLGDDWNGTGGGNTDLGDDVFSIGNGVVVSAENLGGGWGNVVRILHKQDKILYESIYAHLDTMLVKEGQEVDKGLKIGTIGTADGAYLAHLHLEIRNDIHMDIGGGYAEDATGYLDPTLFIKTH